MKLLSCETCVAYDEVSRTCHVGPPTVVVMQVNDYHSRSHDKMFTAWPDVAPSDWCLEHKAEA